MSIIPSPAVSPGPVNLTAGQSIAGTYTLFAGPYLHARSIFCDGVSDFMIRLDGNHTMSATDFGL